MDFVWLSALVKNDEVKRPDMPPSFGEKKMIFIYFINMFDEICVRQQRIQVSLKCFLLILQVKNMANTDTGPRSQKNVKETHHLTDLCIDL